jgi:biopolymer transport protein ExbD
MLLKALNKFHTTEQSFNMTPVIDIVFQLIIFFSLVCRFIGEENFPVDVPDKCQFSKSETQAEGRITTVTVMKKSDGDVDFAVGSEKISAANRSAVVNRLARSIDVYLKDLPPVQRIVTLRIDRDVCFADAQYALAGVAASSATDIKLATLKDKRVVSE